jgi:hypothetical protein
MMMTLRRPGKEIHMTRRRGQSGIEIVLPLRLAALSVFLWHGAPVPAMEPPAVQWELTIGDPGVCDCHSDLRQTTDGSYIISGGWGEDCQADAYLVKVSEGGWEEWRQKFNQDRWDFAAAVLQTADGNYVLGATASNVHQRRALLVRTDPSGTELGREMPLEWFKVRWLHETEDGGLIAGGEAREPPFAFGLLRTDGDFKQLWFHVYDFVDPSCLCINYAGWPARDGGYVLIGSAEMDGPSDIAILWVDRNGNQKKSKVIATPSAKDMALGGCEAHEGGNIIVGYTAVTPSPSDVLVLKTDESGAEEWRKTYGGDGQDYATSVAPTSDGGYIISGVNSSLGDPPVMRVYLIKTDGNGAEQWSGTFGPPVEKGWSQYRGSVAQTHDGGYVASKTVLEPDSEFNDIYLVKLAPEAPEETFQRGRTNDDGKLDLNDPTCLLGYLFGRADDPCKSVVPGCLDAADADDDGKVGITDAIYILLHLFQGGPSLPSPSGACGPDPTPDALDCRASPGCP